MDEEAGDELAYALLSGRSFRVRVPVTTGLVQLGQGCRVAVRFCWRPVYAQVAQETRTRSQGRLLDPGTNVSPGLPHAGDRPVHVSVWLSPLVRDVHLTVMGVQVECRVQMSRPCG